MCFDVRACETNGGRSDEEEGREGPGAMGWQEEHWVNLKAYRFGYVLKSKSPKL